MDDTQIAEELEQYDDSIQELIENLLAEYFTADGQDVSLAAMAVRRRRLQREKESLKQRKRKILEGIRNVEEELEILDDAAHEVTQDERIQQSLDTLAGIPEEHRDPSNAAIQKHAKRCGLKPATFLELLNDEYPTNQYGEPLTPF